MRLTPAELARYSRQMRLPEVGADGQQRLRDASVLIVGAGGLGSPVATYLAAAGVGRIGLVDFDTVEVSNLHRQPLYTLADAGRLKVDVAAERLAALNPHVAVEVHPVRLGASNAAALVARYDVVADGTDTFETRYLVNDACVLAGRPNAYASVGQFSGQAAVFAAALPDGRRGPCYRCVFPEPPPAGAVPSCAEGGVLGVLPGLLGTIQAAEALKLILGVGQSLSGRLLVFDALATKFRTLKLRKDPGCRVCSKKPEDIELIDYEAFCSLAQ